MKCSKRENDANSKNRLANNMLKALQNILLAVSGLLFCWIAPVCATYDALRRDRGSFLECQRREWARWWGVYADLRA